MKQLSVRENPNYSNLEMHLANLDMLCSQWFFSTFILHSHIPYWSPEIKTSLALSPSLTCLVKQHWEIALLLNIYPLSHVLKPETQWLRGSLHTLSHLSGFGQGEKENTLLCLERPWGEKGNQSNHFECADSKMSMKIRVLQALMSHWSSFLYFKSALRYSGDRNCGKQMVPSPGGTNY